MLLTSFSISQIPIVASQIIKLAENVRILLFYGDMGAGKTTLIKSLCEELGAIEPITSPTFSIVNEYEGGEATIYHFDFYRLKDQTEALDMGYEEYFYSGAWCFIEWPEKITDLIPDHYVKISLSVQKEGLRHIIVEKI